MIGPDSLRERHPASSASAPSAPRKPRRSNLLSMRLNIMGHTIFGSRRTSARVSPRERSGAGGARARACRGVRGAQPLGVIMTAQQQRQLDEDGYVVLESVMSADLLRDLRRRIFELFDEEGDRAGHEFRTEE